MHLIKRLWLCTHIWTFFPGPGGQMQIRHVLPFFSIFALNWE